MMKNILLASLMVSLTTAIHYLGFLLLIKFLGGNARRLHVGEHAARRALLLALVILGIMAVHGLEVWLYAAVYLVLGVLPDFETALYYSTTTFSTIGFGDVTIDKEWRIFSAIEGANGLILFGWSTAFLTALIFRMFEYDWRALSQHKP